MRTQMTIAALGLVSTLVWAAPANADPNRITRDVEYGDLDLTSATGARALRYRVSDAVTELCSEAIGSDDGNAEIKFAVMRCRKDAWLGARPQMTQIVAAARTGKTDTAGLTVAVGASATRAR